MHLQWLQHLILYWTRHHQAEPLDNMFTHGSGHWTLLCPARGLAPVGRVGLTLQSLQTHPEFCWLWENRVKAHLPSNTLPFCGRCPAPWWILLKSRARSGESDICTCVLVYSLFHYSRSLKHLHDALKYSWPFLFNFICLLVFGDNPAKHFSKFNKVHTTINVGANNNGGQHFIQSIIIRLEAQIFQGIK